MHEISGQSSQVFEPAVNSNAERYQTNLYLKKYITQYARRIA